MKTRFLFVGRGSELEWLDRNSRLSPVLALVGVRGIGKTWLARHWSEKSSLKTRWYSADRLQSLPELLGESGDPESALEQASRSWGDLDAVIWDDVEQIPAKARNTLMAFLKAKPDLPLQILISEEELARDNPMELPQLKLGPFTKDDIRSLLTNLLTEAEMPTAETLRDLEVKTGGIPLLLKLWLQAPHHSSLHVKSVLDTLPALDQRLFGLSAAFGRIFSRADLCAFAGSSVSTDEVEQSLENLLRKNLVEGLQRQSTFHIPSYIRNLYWKEISDAEKTRFKKTLLSRLTAQPTADPFEVFHLAIEAGDFECANTQIDKIPTEKLETLGSADLTELTAGLKRGFEAAKSASSPLQTRTQWVRLHMRALFLAGDRAEALKQAEQIIQEIASSPTLSASAPMFILEYVELLNRNSQFDDARKTGRSFMQKIQEPVRSLLSIEVGVAHLSTDLKLAQETLSETLRTAKKALVQTPDDREWNLVQAQAAFQLGRTLDFTRQWKESEKLFLLAQASFKRAGQTYPATASSMNRAWVLLQLQNWESLAAVLTETQQEADRFGYRYVLAGLSVVESHQNRLFLKPGQSLPKLEMAVKYLGATLPTQPVVETLAERVRTYLHLGLRARAKLQALVDRKTDGTLKEPIESLRQEFELIDLPYGDWIERWEHSPYGLDIRQRLMARMDSTQLSSETLESLCACPFGRVYSLESQVTSALSRGERELAWRFISGLESTLETAEPCGEKIALLLLQASLIESEERRGELQDQADIELQRWGCDGEVKAPLQAWLNSMRAGQNRRAPDHDPLWKKATPGDRDRWKKWWIPFWAAQTKAYRVHQLHGVEERDDAPSSKDHPKGLFISEKLSEVFCNGKRLHELSRRHSLRKLLALIVECHPQAVSKATLAGTLWGEAYNPAVHDPRIYTSVQRLRSLLSLRDPIQSIEQGYRWNPVLPFVLVRQARPENTTADGNPRTQALILHALESFAQNGREWVSRSDLVEVASSSDATVKRELSRLLTEALIRRRGAGRSVEYSKSTSSFGSRA
jgi:hypothetical protein